MVGMQNLGVNSDLLHGENLIKMQEFQLKCRSEAQATSVMSVTGLDRCA